MIKSCNGAVILEMNLDLSYFKENYTIRVCSESRSVATLQFETGKAIKYENLPIEDFQSMRKEISNIAKRKFEKNTKVKALCDNTFSYSVRTKDVNRFRQGCFPDKSQRFSSLKDLYFYYYQLNQSKRL